jgi:hypothetical protein
VSWRVRGALLVALLGMVGVESCSLIGVRGPRRPVVAGTEVSCTDSYALPAVDAAGVAAVAGGGILLAANRDAIEGGDAHGWFSPYFPYALAAAAAVPFVISAIGGARMVHDCRDAEGWLGANQRPPAAGREGGPCVAVADGPDICDPGYVCSAGRCSAPTGWPQ